MGLEGELPSPLLKWLHLVVESDEYEYICGASRIFYCID
jgi:hypothetical protein